MLITSGLGIGGSEIQFYQLALGLQEKGWLVDVVSLQRGGEYRTKLESSGIRVTDCAMGRIASPASLLRLRSIIRSRRPCLVHTQAFRATLWGRAVAIAVGIPVVASIRATYSYIPNAYYPVERRLTRRSGKVIVPSQATASHLIEAVRLPADKVVVIQNGVDTLSLDPTTAAAELARQRMGIASDEFVVLVPGRLIATKDHPTMLRAFHLLLKQRPRSLLLMAGAGPLREELEALARPFGDRVRFLGQLNREQMATALHSADVVSLMSRLEGMPNVVLEAMAAGRPVVATAVDGVPEVVKDGVNGRLVRIGDAESCATHLIDLSDNPALRQEMGRRGRESAEAEHSIAVNVRHHMELYEQVLAGGPASAKSRD